MSERREWEPPRSHSFKDGDFTVVEHPQAGNRGLAVRAVTPEQKKTVWRWGGFLFATAADAEAFAKGEMMFDENGPPHARQAFSHKRVDGLRIYVHQSGIV
jgi:hypothetical protein